MTLLPRYEFPLFLEKVRNASSLELRQGVFDCYQLSFLTQAPLRAHSG